LLPKEREKEIIEYLEYREKEYDARLYMDLFSTAHSLAVKDALVYIATPESEQYLGIASLDALAKQIATAKGPSGDNCEYLYRLADSMRELDVEDIELFELEAKVRNNIKQMLSIGCSMPEI